MCRLFGLHAGPTPVAATFWLLDAPDSLAEQSHRNPDGVGIGSFDAAGRPAVDKQPLAAWEDAEFATAARELRSSTFLAHVRYASTGDLSERNTHPFVQDGRLFAHNGVVQSLDELDSRLQALGATGLVHGETDSERVFALITAETRLHEGDVTQGLSAALGWIIDHLPVYSLNLILTTAQELWAFRYPETHDLFVLSRPPGGHARASLDARSARIHARSEHLARGASVILASEPMDTDPAWRLLEPNELLHVTSALVVESSSDLLGRPRQLLRRADLDPATAASQHPGRVG